MALPKVWVWGLAPLAAVAMFGGMTAITLTADVPLPNTTQRLIYRTVFLHVPAAVAGRLLLYAILVACLLYLWRRRPLFDWVNRGCVEVALLAYTFVVMSGMMWGESAWGIAWNWEPRLTSAAIMWFMLVAALLLRSAIDDPLKRRLFAAVYGIAFVIGEVFVRYSTHWFSGELHPDRGTLGSTAGYDAVQGQMGVCIALGLAGFVLLAAFRVAVEAAVDQNGRKG